MTLRSPSALLGVFSLAVPKAFDFGLLRFARVAHALGAERRLELFERSWAKRVSAIPTGTLRSSPCRW
jgi:hypothetical protein